MNKSMERKISVQDVLTEVEFIETDESSFKRGNKGHNKVNVIHPYRTASRTWVYDDADIPVKGEAFVMGSSELIDMLVGEECNSFTAAISAEPLPNETVVLDNIDHEKANEPYPMNGFYRMRGSQHENWLCGCVLDYFIGYPKEIHVSIYNMKS